MTALAIVETSPPGFQAWLASGHDLLTRRNEVEWELADWINAGRERFGNQADFDFLADNLGIAPRRLKAACKVAGTFPPSLRDRQLTFEHHEAVVTLPLHDALAVLKRAHVDKLDDRETRIAAVRRKGEIDPAYEPEEDFEQAELVALARAWNRARLSVREDFAAMIEETGMEDIDA